MSPPTYLSIFMPLTSSFIISFAGTAAFVWNSHTELWHLYAYHFWPLFSHFISFIHFLQIFIEKSGNSDTIGVRDEKHDITYILLRNIVVKLNCRNISAFYLFAVHTCLQRTPGKKLSYYQVGCKTPIIDVRRMADLLNRPKRNENRNCRSR